MTDHWFEKREKRIDEILGRIRKTGFIQKQPLGHVVKDIVYVMHFLHEASVDEQVRETLAYFRMQERERIQDNGWDCRKIEGEELKDPANLALRQARAREQIAKEIEIETERLAKEAKAAKKAEKKAEKRRRREQAADELSVDLRKNLEYWQEKKHAKEKTVWPVKPLKAN